MSENVIDERVVSMKFDNKEFEKNATQSLSTIQKLKQALNFNSAVKNLDTLKSAAKSFQLNGIANSVETIKNKFSVMEVAARAAITNITNSFVNSAKKMVESVTIDPVRTGLGVYEQKLNSVQTMLNNSGQGLGKVTEVLDELNEYSDKTIFSLNDMTTALGKFTAQGVDLEKAARIIKGAANEAASMGAGSAEFSRFIYNLTQAYGMGKMTTIDWRSLENAGVAGREFKEQLIESAKALGTIDEKGMYKGQLVTTANLREFLKDGIITADVMTDTFEKYADVTTNLGKKASDAATQIKTFHQLLDVLAESVASTWSQSFGYIIGDFHEAKRLWTNISKMFDQTVGKMNENRNKLLKAWHDGFIDPAVTSTERLKEFDQAIRTGAFIGDKDLDARVSGRTMLLDGLANVLNALLTAIKPVKEAFQEVFPATTAKGLWEATKNFRDFTAQLKLSEGALKEIKDAAKGVFTVLSFGKTMIKDILGALIPATKEVDSLLVIVIKIAGWLGRLTTKTIESLRTSEDYQFALKEIGNAAVVVIKVIGKIIALIIKFIRYGKETGLIGKAFNVIVAAVQLFIATFSKVAPVVITVLRVIGLAVGTLLMLIGTVAEKIHDVFRGLFGKGESKQIGENVVEGVTIGIFSGIKNLVGAVGALASAIIETFCKALGIHSPSMVFAALGAFIVAGLMIGLASAGGLLSESENVILQAIGKIGQSITDVASKIKYFVVDVMDDSSALVTHMQGVEGKLSDSSVGLVERLGAGIRVITGYIKQLNWGAVVVIGILGILFYNVTRIISTVYNVGRAARDGMDSIRRMTKGFKDMTTAFRRMHSPLIETLKGIAICVMGIAASLWLLSTLKTTGNLIPSLAALLISFTLIMIVASTAAKFVHDNELTDDMKNLALMVLAMSGSFIIMGIAFGQMVDILKGINNDGDLLWSALLTIGALAGMMVGANYLLIKAGNTQSLKTMASVLLWAFSLKKVIAALGDLISESQKMKGENGTYDFTPLIVGLGSVLTLMLAVGLLGMAYKDTGFGSAATVLVIIFGIKQLLKVIQDIDWAAAVPYINSMHNTLVIMAMALTVIATVMALTGSGMKDFGTGLLYIVGAIAGMVLVCKMVEKLNISPDAIDKAIKIAMAVGVLAGALIIAMHFFDVPVGKFTGFSFMLLALDTVMLALAKTVQIVNSSGDFNQGKDTFTRVALCMSGLVLMLAVLGMAMAFTKDAEVGRFALVIFGVAGVILSLAVLAKAMDYMDGPHMVAVLGSAVVVFAGLFFLIAAMTHLDTDTPIKPVIALIGALLVIFGSLVVLTLTPMDKLITSTIMMAALMGILCGVLLAMAEVKETKTGPMIALVAALVVISGSLLLLSQYSWEQLYVPALAMIGIMAAFALIVAMMAKIKPESTSPMLVAVIAVLAVAASLGFLAMMDWPGIVNSAISMSIALLAVAAAMRIVSGSKGGAVNLLASALAIVIVASSLIIIAAALNTFNAVDWDTTWQACACIGAITAALAILGLVGPNVLIGAASMIVASIAFTVLAVAMQGFAQIDWETFYVAAASLGALIVAIALLGLLSVDALLGAAALIASSIGLLMLAAAMHAIEDAGGLAAAGHLAVLAASLLAIGLAGIVLGMGASGLIFGGLGLKIIAPALVILGEAYKNLNGAQLAGIAGGLMAMGVAGVMLMLGAEGLITGGIGLSIMAPGLIKIANANIKGKNLKDIGDGLIDIAKAGVIATVGGIGLINMGIGIAILTSKLRELSQTYVEIAEIDFQKLADDSVQMGSNIIGGLATGISSGLPVLAMATAAMASVIENTFRNIMGIHSDSSLFITLGKFILSGLGVGVSDETLNSGIGKTMKAVADNLLNSFTSEFGGGLDKIGGMFKGMFGNDELEKELKEQKKLFDELIAGRDSYYKKYTAPGARAKYEKDIGRVAERIAKLEAEISANSMGSVFGDALGINFSEIASEFKNLFSEDAMAGVLDLGDWFKDLDFSVDDVTNSLGNMNLAIDDTNLSTSELTKNMAKSVDVFAEYDKSLTTTTADIKKNLLDNLIGEEEFQSNLNNLLALGFDPAMVAEIGEKGKESGNEIAQALLYGALGDDPYFVEWYNKKYAQAQLYSKGTEMLIEVAKKAAEEGKDIKEYGIQWRDDVQYFTGEGSKVNSTFDVTKIPGADDIDKATDDILAAERDQRDALKKEAEKNEAEAKKKQTTEENEKVANQAVYDLSEAVKTAINKYMPATSFVELGKNICIGLASGIWGYMELSTRAVEMSANELITAFAKKIDSHSPSKVFEQFGQYIQEGLSKGIDENSDATNSTKELGDNLLKQFKAVLEQIMAVMEMDDTWQPTIRPVVDFTNIQTGAYEAQRLMNGITLPATVMAANRDIQASKEPTYGTSTMATMTKDEFRQFLTNFADTIVDGITSNDGSPVSVNVNLEGDAKGIFKVVKDENAEYKKTKGRSAFA